MTSTATRRSPRFILSLLLAASALALWGAGSADAASETFLPTGAEQTYTVPAGVTGVHVVAIGGKGATQPKGGAGGFGAMASADLSVTPGQILYVEVGGNGNGLTGGFNGGGSSGAGPTKGGGGGGASDVRTAPRAAGTSLALRLIVAGGGGGGGGSTPGFPTTNFGGTAGPFPTAGTGYGTDSQPGSATAGGAGGSGCETGDPGVLGAGGNGGDETCNPGAGGAGGGGGLYGGGGGGSSSASSGGGAGSSGFGTGATNTSIATDVTGAPSISITPNPAVPGTGTTTQPPTEPQPQPTLAGPPAPVKCVVPKLSGRKLRGARKALAGSNCKLGLVSGRKRGGPVIGQRPKAGKELPAGTEVSVTLGAARN